MLFYNAVFISYNTGFFSITETERKVNAGYARLGIDQLYFVDNRTDQSVFYITEPMKDWKLIAKNLAQAYECQVGV